MIPAFLDEKHVARMERMKKANPNVDIEKHKRDYYICQAYLNNKDDGGEFEALLSESLKKLEYMLGRGSKKDSSGDDYVSIYEMVVETVLARLPQFSGGSLFSTWVYGIMLNMRRTYYRQKTKRNECALHDGIVSEVGDMESALANKEQLQSAVKLLKKSEARLLTLISGGYSYEEVAQMLELDEKTVKTKYKKILKKLKTSLTSDEQ